MFLFPLIAKADRCFTEHATFSFGKFGIWTADVRILASGFQRDISRLEHRVCIFAQWGRKTNNIKSMQHWLWNQLPFKSQGYWINELVLEGCVSFLESWERKSNINPVHIYNVQFIATCRLNHMVETFFHSLRLFCVWCPSYSRSFNWLALCDQNNKTSVDNNLENKLVLPKLAWAIKCLL